MSAPPIGSADLHQLQREYGLALRLLELGQQRDLEPFLQEALALVVEAVDARQGYLELCDDDAQGETRWWIAHGFSGAEVSSVRSAISHGIIAEALASGETVITPSAVLDPRFGTNDSVRRGQIDAVMCTPIGADPPRGILYLQGRAVPGLFSAEERDRAERFVRHLAPLADRLLTEHRHRMLGDATSPLRATLRLDGVIGRSPALAAVLKQAALVAPLDINVLLTGENGTGKSQLARVIHDNSPRAGGPFVAINCAAMQDTLVERELFGTAEGAYTDARKSPGTVAAADGGTLLLDEVALLSPAAQAKLLMFLATKEYRPIGDTNAITADVRVIAATNTDLKQAVADRTFREDLFYRLQVMPIRMPSLAERTADIPDLATHCCARACARNSLRPLELSRGALQALASAAWPGNVRQLENAIEAAAIRANSEGVTQIEADHIFPAAGGAPAEPTNLTFQDATRRFQIELLRRTLQDTDWNVVETAKRLDLARSHVYNLIKAFGLARGA